MTQEHIERFNLVASKYRTDSCRGRSQCMDMVLSLLDPQKDDIVLDVGCGPGTQLIGLAPFIRRGYGIDPAEEMIRRAVHAAAGSPNITFHVGRAEEDMPPGINESGIHKIFSNYALHHLSEEGKGRAIRNLASLLPADGLIVLGDLMFSDDPDRHRDLFDSVGYGPGSDTPSGVSSLEAMFVAAGLSPVTYTLNPLTGVVVGRKA